MAYIGRDTDKISNIEKLDTITFDGSSSYTLQKNSVNFTPNSANSLQISIDGVVQAGNFTVSGSTIDFGVAIPATSTNDFIFHYGTGLVTTVADGAITDAKLANSVITGQTEDSSPADDDLILVYDTSATALKKVQKSNFAGGGITMVDNWRVNSSFTGSVNPISSNWERNDSNAPAFGYYGSQMSQSSGIFTFPSTGIYLVLATFQAYLNGDTQYYGIEVQVTANNSSYSVLATNYAHIKNVINPTYSAISTSGTVDITDTTNQKIRFRVVAENSATTTVAESTYDHSFVRFIRLGDT